MKDEVNVNDHLCHTHFIDMLQYKFVRLQDLSFLIHDGTEIQLVIFTVESIKI